MKTPRSRSLVKTLTWRIVATTDTFLIAWLITGHVDWAAGIAGIEVLTKMFLYYGHERVWAGIKWKKVQNEEHTTIFPYTEKRRSDSVWPYKD
jgi:uncharacterized membrane protein